MSKLNYQLFLIQDDFTYAELEVEDLDLVTTIGISDVQDISVKKDNISQNIKIKGSKTNNRILGNLFNRNRIVDADSTDKLNHNFSLNRKVECVVLEDSIVIIKGFLKLNSPTKKDGVYEYEGIISGNIVNFFASVNKDTQLSDLDFSEYTHDYNIFSILDTWENDNGYVYPMINYGVRNSSDFNKIDIANFRLAIYLNQYLRKIFALPELKDFTYEIKGSESFLAELDSLIIPSNEENFTQSRTGNLLNFTNATTQVKAPNQVTNGQLRKFLRFDTINDPNQMVGENSFQFFGQTFNLIRWERSVSSDMGITFDIFIRNSNSNPITTTVKLVERDYSENSDSNSFSTVSEQVINVSGGNTTYSGSIVFNVPERTYGQNKQFGVMLQADGTNVDYSSAYDIQTSNLVLNTPSTPLNKTTFEVKIGDTIKPMPVSGVSVRDFLKSFTLLYNLFTYSTLDSPKHIIFETYNDYYSACRPSQLALKGLDWSQKMDISGDLSILPVENLSKKIHFSYKSDSDYWNEVYSKNYNEVYGNRIELGNSDSATSDEKKIELIFSSTPLVSVSGTGRLTPEIFKQDGSGRSPMKSNIRILHYNGVKDCIPYGIGSYDGSGNFTNLLPTPLNGTINYYPQCGHIKYQHGRAMFDYVSDLNFSLPKQFYFQANQSIYVMPNQYTRFYQNQILEITNLNSNLFECEILLNEVDISNLNLKLPVLISDEDGTAYYKILKIDYLNRFQTSTVQLQRII